ncbi:MAG TPA: DUF4332 domain-containing protein [Gemmatimonadaceae bacterium]|jgi:predicted flap endonuclease-1-like 5' DNA nuclease|nr:DUF4332 domain-containing protein [Gemmatimonadaceae bacterium]
MTYKIEAIEGVGPFFAERLHTVGVHSTDDLLTRCGTDLRRREVAAALGISPMMLTLWTRQADLMRIRGVGAEYGQLLAHAGVESVAHLATYEPDVLARGLARANAERKLVRVLPSSRMVARWVREAAELAPQRPLA